MLIKKYFANVTALFPVVAGFLLMVFFGCEKNDIKVASSELAGPPGPNYNCMPLNSDSFSVSAFHTKHNLSMYKNFDLNGYYFIDGYGSNHDIRITFSNMSQPPVQGGVLNVDPGYFFTWPSVYAGQCAIEVDDYGVKAYGVSGTVKLTVSNGVLSAKFCNVKFEAYDNFGNNTGYVYGNAYLSK